MAEIVEIKANDDLGGGYHRLVVTSESLQTASPGQFAHILVQASSEPKQWDPLLRRPLSIYDQNGGEASFLYKLVGRGTKILARRLPGETLDLLGPLGTGFQLEARPALLVGGGVGAAPLLFLARKLLAQKREVVVLLGAQTGRELAFAEDFQALTPNLYLTTDDGSVGACGLVTEAIPKLLEGFSAPPKLYACGPVPMLACLAELAVEYGLPLDVSLEAQMACGIGACLACTCFLADGTTARVCADGPVFPYEQIDWREQGA